MLVQSKAASHRPSKYEDKIRSYLTEKKVEFATLEKNKNKAAVIKEKLTANLTEKQVHEK